MKPIHFSFLTLSTLVFFALACAPTAPNVTDTTTLVSGSKTLVLTKTDSVKSTPVSMTCGCPFPIFIDGKGGDVNAISIVFADNIADTITPHSLKASISPSTLAPASYAAWIALHSIHEEAETGPTLLRDTVYITATVQ